jgi:multidrug efflux pump subunit AcrA (membrane-fusion protein)
MGDGTPSDERAELEQQLALYREQLAALQAESADPGLIARTAVAAGRVAERLNDDQAPGLYDQALALSPGYAPALRGRLRLLIQTGALTEARAAATALAEVAPEERAAYQLILEHTRPDDGTPGERPEGPGSVGRLLLDCERALARNDRPAAATALQTLAEVLPGDLQPAAARVRGGPVRDRRRCAGGGPPAWAARWFGRGRRARGSRRCERRCG